MNMDMSEDIKQYKEQLEHGTNALSMFTMTAHIYDPTKRHGTGHPRKRWKE
jgi:hypothetical protein